ncbi:MAG: cell wall hydrolase [Clostridium sp.]|nr:cell wall hydrolase [Acetatifactor muris]MCM1525846.1 cell wall hydrolase [Bacteroides sp.]MCM1562614.1 cell wall hydrolase [Clostridium sp.]
MRRAAAVLIALTLVCMAGSDGRLTGSIHASATGTREQIEQAEREKNELENRQEQIENDISGLQSDKKTLQGELNQLNTQLTEISDRLADLESQIAAKEQDIADTQAALDEAKATEQSQYENMVLRVRKMYERNDTSSLNAIISTVFSAGSFSDMLNAADGFEKIASYDKNMLDEYKENRRLIEEHEARLQQEKIDLDGLKVEAEAEKSKVAGLISQTSLSIADYADQISEAEALARANEEEIKKKEEDLEYLRQKLAEELAMSQAAAAGVWRDISEVSFADSDRYLLANLIYCEAGAEPYAGKLAVGSVVINRVLSSKYPDSVLGVIYQNKQFSPVASGRLALALDTNKATVECYQAADEAMSGVSNVGYCVYFRTPVEGLSGINIGGHVFY